MRGSRGAELVSGGQSSEADAAPDARRTRAASDCLLGWRQFRHDVALGDELIPGARYPCRNCDGRFHVSRYHFTRCSHVIRILGSRYNWRAHARFAEQTDNVLDAMFMDLVPENATTEYIRRRLRRCPTVPTTKARSEPSLPIYEDTGRQWTA